MQRAVALDPSYAQAYHMMAMTKFGGGRHRESLQVCLLAKTRNTHNEHNTHTHNTYHTHHTQISHTAHTIHTTH